jgi:hypothetical protein
VQTGHMTTMYPADVVIVRRDLLAPKAAASRDPAFEI